MGRLSRVTLTLSNLEHELLRKLLNGESVTLSSQQRLRLELAGVIREGAAGITVTADGRRLASQKPPAETAAPISPTPDSTVILDRRGRRKPFQRKSVF
jgi:hypothetical protein